jgi:hypothetical protein
VRGGCGQCGAGGKGARDGTMYRMVEFEQDAMTQNVRIPTHVSVQIP